MIEGRPMTDLAWLTIAEAAELLRGKKLSPVEYAKALIARVEKHDGKLNAYLRFTPEIALADAKRAEDESCAGHGVPVSACWSQDIVDYAGPPTTPFEILGISPQPTPQ
jgi:aspartyl-tRNA(Asn)/glutamyl-tRNA(Gln) amidotransferase subunit A